MSYSFRKSEVEAAADGPATIMMFDHECLSDSAVIYAACDVPAGITSPKTKKADVAEHHEVFDHVGLLFNEPPGTGQAALYIVDRKSCLETAGARGSFTRAAIADASIIILHYRPKLHPIGN